MYVLASVPQKPDAPTNDATTSDETKIRVLYGTTLPDNGGSDIIDIQLSMDDGLGGDFTVMTTIYSMATFMTIENLTQGLTYRFKYKCANENGWSDFSDIAYIRVATVPQAPLPPQLVQATSL